MTLRKEKIDNKWIKPVYILITKFHWTMDDIKNLPLSTIDELIKLMHWEQKEIEKEQRKR